jgi:hypothetical protein
MSTTRKQKGHAATLPLIGSQQSAAVAARWHRAVLALSLVALMSPTGLAKSDPGNPGFDLVTRIDSSQVLFDVHGAQVVWFDQSSPDHADLVLENLTDRTPQVLTTVRASHGSLDLQALSFDGRWAAWCDDRFGNFEVFGLDTATGALVRVTEAGPDDVEATVDHGRIAWSRSNQIWMHDLGNGTTWQVAGAGQAREPALAGQTLAWIRLDGFARAVVSSSPSGQGLHVLSEENGVFAHALHAEDGLLAWELWKLKDPAAPVKGYGSTVVQAVRIQDGTVLNLTSVPVGNQGQTLGTSVGGGRVAWVDLASSRIHYWPDGGQTDPPESDPTGVALSDHYLVVSEAPSPGSSELAARPWSAPAKAHGWPMPGLGWEATVLACLVVGASLRRR